MSSPRVEVVFSFDTTGSMYPCLTQVRRNLKSTVTRLSEEIPGIRVGVVAHGDYCDAGSSYVTKTLDLTDDVGKLCHFVETVEATNGGDAPECYELVLHEAQNLSWTAGANKALVLIGDDVPHPPNHTPGRLEWRKEAENLARAGVAVYGVQCLGRKYANQFYEELSRSTGGSHIDLDQFAFVTDMVLAICYKQSSVEQLKRYEQEVKTQGRMTRGLNKIFDKMLDRRAPAPEFGSADLRAVSPGRFQVLDVDRDCAIKEFVLENGLTFDTGRGFYEFTKTETIQGHKEVVLMDRRTGDLFAGKSGREMLGLPDGETVRVQPTVLDRYVVFVQSTSANRKLMKGTKFLYEVGDWSRGR